MIGSHRIVFLVSGFRYWDLTHHPKGGDFHRLSEDTLLTSISSTEATSAVAFPMADAFACQKGAIDKGAIDRVSGGLAAVLWRPPFTSKRLPVSADTTSGVLTHRNVAESRAVER